MKKNEDPFSITFGEVLRRVVKSGLTVYKMTDTQYKIRFEVPYNGRIHEYKGSIEEILIYISKFIDGITMNID